MPFSRGSSWPGIEPVSFMSPALARGFLTTSTTSSASKITLRRVFLEWHALAQIIRQGAYFPYLIKIVLVSVQKG